MTRIVQQKYACGYCGNELSRPILASCNSAIGFVRPSDLKQRYYVCPHCLYSGIDLSIPPSAKQKEILSTKEFDFFLKNGFVYQQSFKAFILGYTFYKEGKYPKAISLLSQAYHAGHALAPFKQTKELQYFEDYLAQKDVDYEIILDHSPELFDLYLDQLIVEIAIKMHFRYASRNVSCWIIDALRRTGRFEQALALIDDALSKDLDKEHKALLMEEQQLCLKKDYKAELDLPVCRIPYIY